MRHRSGPVPIARSVACALALASPAAIAVDGVIEINEARVVAGNITPGDTAGYPITLSRPGHYRLTGNLDISALANAANTFVFSVTADDVALDLNGFGIFGPTDCSGLPPTSAVNCTPVGGGAGISAALVERFSVSNGSIHGTGANGIACGAACRVSHVSVSDSGNIGIAAGPGSTVWHSTVDGSRLQGIDVNTGSQVLHSVARRTGSSGIVTRGGSLVVSNVVTHSGDFGLSAGASTTGYVGNVLHNNNGGNANAQVFSGTQIGTNLCAGSTTCP